VIIAGIVDLIVVWCQVETNGQAIHKRMDDNLSIFAVADRQGL